MKDHPSTDLVSDAERAVLAAADARFAKHMVERHFHNEQDVLNDLKLSKGSAADLIRAVALWRIAKREAT